MGRPLNPTELQNRRLSVVIHWPPTREPGHGHGALIIDTQKFQTGASDYYVSWMGAGTGKNALQQPGAAQTFFSDTMTWGPQGNNNGTLPTRWVALKGLDIVAMKQAWDNLRNKPNAHWKLFDKNCATGVARVLKAGGADDYATKAQNQAVWWPSDLIKYAKSMGTAVVSTS
jgi:hypothetical protein